MCSAVIIHVKYDDRGMFNISRLANELETAREYVAYIIADEASFLRFHFAGKKSSSTVRLSVSVYYCMSHGKRTVFFSVVIWKPCNLLVFTAVILGITFIIY